LGRPFIGSARFAFWSDRVTPPPISKGKIFIPNDLSRERLASSLQNIELQWFSGKILWNKELEAKVEIRIRNSRYRRTEDDPWREAYEHAPIVTGLVFSVKVMRHTQRIFSVENASVVLPRRSNLLRS
jgi:hypothetical protein